MSFTCSNLRSFLRWLLPLPSDFRSANRQLSTVAVRHRNRGRLSSGRPMETQVFLSSFLSMWTRRQVWRELRHLLVVRDISLEAGKIFLTRWIAKFEIEISTQATRLELRRILFSILAFYDHNWRLLNDPLYDRAFTNILKCSILRTNSKLVLSLSYNKISVQTHDQYLHLRSYWSIQGLAEEFCIISKDVLSKINGSEVGVLTTRQPGVRRAIEIFNRISYVISLDILASTSSEQAVQTIKYYLKVASVLHQRKNYDMLAVVVASFSRWQIDRLQNVWTRLSPNKRGQLARLNNVISSQNNYSAYRNEITNLLPGTCYVPLISLLLRDIIHINEANPRYRENKTINLDYLMLLSRSLSVLESAKLVYPELGRTMSPILRRLIYDGVAYDDDILAIRSYSLYPNKLPSVILNGNVAQTPEDIHSPASSGIELTKGKLPDAYQNFEIPFQGSLGEVPNASLRSLETIGRIRSFGSPNEHTDLNRALRYYLIAFRDPRRWTPGDVFLWLSRYHFDEEIMAKLLGSNINGTNLFVGGRASYSFLGLSVETYFRLEQLVQITINQHCKHAEEMRAVTGSGAVTGSKYPPLLRIAPLTRYDIAAWCIFSGLSRISSLFLSRGIDGHLLSQMTANEFMALGLSRETNENNRISEIDKVLQFGRDIVQSNVLFRPSSSDL